jgi:beta-glucosidase
VKKLRAFRRVTLAPGAASKVDLVLGPDAFALWDKDMKHVVEPGTFEIMCGPNSIQLKKTTLEITN